MRTSFIAIAALFASSTAAYSQQCTPALESCNQMLEAAEILQVRAGIGLAGGNPVPGANSTLGMRIRSVPRISIAVRATGVGLDMPAVALLNNESEFKSLAHSWNVDAALAMFGGKMLAPTVGGFGSVDLIASVGKLSLPNNHGLTDDPGSWAFGARVGVLRESFTAPGVSISAMYREIGDMHGGNSVVTPAGPISQSFDLTSNSVLSLRTVVGKRLFVVGANAGIGYDSFHSDLKANAAYTWNPPPPSSGGGSYSEGGFGQHRITGFVNATWTMLIVNFVAEAGYQRGGDTFTAALPSGQTSKTQKAGYYGSLAFRLAL